MKTRTEGFIAEDKIDQNGEIFDYIRELHEYLWQYVRLFYPSASGSLSDWVDKASDEAEAIRKEERGRIIKYPIHWQALKEE